MHCCWHAEIWGPAYEAVNIKGDPSAPAMQFNTLSVRPARFEDRRTLPTQMENLNRLNYRMRGPTPPTTDLAPMPFHSSQAAPWRGR